jgi:hypothetical protein
MPAASALPTGGYAVVPRDKAVVELAPTSSGRRWKEDTIFTMLDPVSCFAPLPLPTGLLPTATDTEPLFRAVNSRGAVSPEIRATASSTPVTTPARAARSVMPEITFHLGEPRA